MNKRTWLVFCAVQLIGWIPGSFASPETQNPFVMFPVLAGELLLFPGFFVAIALDDILNRAPTLGVRFAVTVACNVIFWVACSAMLHPQVILGWAKSAHLGVDVDDRSIWWVPRLIGGCFMVGVLLLIAFDFWRVAIR